ncbi:hypothetical protein [Paenirhodobacter enshiensis]|uniref:hypothetical protein n=1 Tax=Paenirhodobacter enshiensis TaxID=1105367 RepID=UPI0035B0B2BF
MALRRSLDEIALGEAPGGVSMKSPQRAPQRGPAEGSLSGRTPLWQETAFLDDTPLGVEEQKGKAGFAFLAKPSFYFLHLEIDASQEDAS